MKKLAIVLLSIVATHSIAKDVLLNSYPFKVTEVVDGDTIKGVVHQWIDTDLTIGVRIFGVNTPEKTWRAKCDKEKELGVKATEFAKAWVDGHELFITNISNDKFGGRIDAIVYNEDGESLGETLLAEGHAAPYFGGKKQDWCK